MLGGCSADDVADAAEGTTSSSSSPSFFFRVKVRPGFAFCVSMLPSLPCTSGSTRIFSICVISDVPASSSK